MHTHAETATAPKYLRWSAFRCIRAVGVVLWSMGMGIKFKMEYKSVCDWDGMMMKWNGMHFICIFCWCILFIWCLCDRCLCLYGMVCVSESEQGLFYVTNSGLFFSQTQSAVAWRGHAPLGWMHDPLSSITSKSNQNEI